VENRSEPHEWLADGSPDEAGPAPDAAPPAGVKTALSAGSGADDPARPGLDGAGTDFDRAGFDGRGGFDGGMDTVGLETPAAGHYGNGNGASPWPSAVADAGNPWPSAAAEASPAPGYAAPAAPPPPVISPAAERPPFPAPAPAPSRPQAQAAPARPAQQQRRQAQAATSPGSIRKASLIVSRVEPWSVMKFSFMMSLVGWVILFIAVALTYFVLSKLGVFTSVEQTVGLVTTGQGHTGADAASWFSASRVLGYTMLVGAVNVILITALATVGAVLYNLVTMLAGGIEVTLKETD
jgi:hypothetical protein